MPLGPREFKEGPLPGEPTGGGEMLEDPLFWVLVLPGVLLGTYAQWRIKANFAEYSQGPN